MRKTVTAQEIGELARAFYAGNMCKPCAGSWAKRVDGLFHCCPLSAAMLEERGIGSPLEPGMWFAEQVAEWAAYHLGDAVRNAFLRGWEGVANISVEADEVQAYEVARQLREQLNPKFIYD
jgi:hypothetical protein